MGRWPGLQAPWRMWEKEALGRHQLGKGWNPKLRNLAFIPQIEVVLKEPVTEE